MAILRLFTRMMTEAGTSDLTEVELQHLIGRTTGGLAASTDIRSVSALPRRVADPYASLGFVVLSGKVRGGEGKAAQMSAYEHMHIYI